MGKHHNNRIFGSGGAGAAGELRILGVGCKNIFQKIHIPQPSKDNYCIISKLEMLALPISLDYVAKLFVFHRGAKLSSFHYGAKLS